MSLATSLTPFNEAVRRFKDVTFSPREHLEAAIENISRAEPVLNVFAHLDLASARRDADASTLRYRRGRPLSPIDGMLVGIKDIIDTADMPTEMGSPIYRGWRPRSDAAAVQAIRCGGGIVLGKTRTTEFAIGAATTTRNPHDTSRTPGGSSSGSAAGVAAGMFNSALGTQTQGSIIRPASYCGVVGYKPTWGMLPLSGVHPVSGSHDHLGAIAENVDSAWRLASWIAEQCPDSQNPRHPASQAPGSQARSPSRIAVLRTAGYKELSPEELAAFDRQLELWRARAIEVVEPAHDPALALFCSEVDKIPEVSMQMVAYEMRWPYESYAERHPDMLGEKIRDLLAKGKAIDEAAHAQHLRSRDDLLRVAGKLGERYDAFVLPAASGIAPKGLAQTGSRTLLVYSSYLGLPACSLPLQCVDSLPFGIQLMGAAHSDHRLISCASSLERGGAMFIAA